MAVRLRQPRHDDSSFQWWIAALVALVALAAVAVALYAVVGVSTILGWFGLDDDAQSGGAESGVNLSEVSDNPDAMYGQTVTISGGLQKLVARNAMLIGNDQFLVGDEVLAVSAEDLPRLVDVAEGEEPEDDIVLLVTGEVQRFDLLTVEDELGVDLDDEQMADYDGRAVVLARAIEVNPPGLGPGDTERQGPSAGFDVNATISDIVKQPETFLGRTVVVSGEVEQVINPNVFRFGDDKLLAVSGEPRNDLFVEPTAYVRGTVREFQILEVEREFGIELDDEAFADFEGDPVIIVESVELVK